MSGRGERILGAGKSFVPLQEKRKKRPPKPRRFRELQASKLDADRQKTYEHSRMDKEVVNYIPLKKIRMITKHDNIRAPGRN